MGATNDEHARSRGVGWRALLPSEQFGNRDVRDGAWREPTVEGQRLTTFLASTEYRRILGHYPTGVCAVTAMDDAVPVGMIVGSFTSVSLDPPLVAFFPDRRSSSWSRIEKGKRFCVNVLADDQHAVCRALSSKGHNKFETVDYRISEDGLPVVDGVVAWIACKLEALHDAGDHFIAIGRVQSLAVENPNEPLLFLRGGFGRFSPLTPRGDDLPA